LREGVFVLLRGYIDESVDKKQNIFSLACLISTLKEWRELERAWKIYLAGWNKRLKKQNRPPITRYHASNCRHLKGEFKGWTVEEQIELTVGLLGVLKRSARTNTIAYDTNLADVCAVFPEASKDRLRAAYSILTKFLISSIGHDQGALDPTGKITLFHDRCDYDHVILQSFNQLVKDPAFAHGSYFRSIAPQSWEDCIALQPADLVAYEVFKETERRLTKPEKETSKALLALLDLPAFGIRSKTLDRNTLFEIKATLYREGFLPEEEDIVRILFRKPSADIVTVHTHSNFTYLSLG
jgi:hypothetical protein